MTLHFDIIDKVTKRIPAVIPHLRGRAGLVYCEHKTIERDPAEPGRERKVKAERRLRLAIQRRFERQLATLSKWLQDNYGKSISASGAFVGDDPQENAEFIRLIYEMTKDGAELTEESVGFALADETINAFALAYARGYVTTFLQSLDDTSSRSIRDAISYFISTPGATIGDVVRLLEGSAFSSDRALRIAVTEITRAYAEGNQIFANQLAAQYPEFKVKKTFYTNVDDRVCPICAPLNGETADYDDEMKIPNPPLHVNCRCWTSVTVKNEDSEPKESLGLFDFENKIVGQDYETAGVYDKNGKLIFEKDGDKNSVHFTQSEVMKFAKNILTHNHPSGSSFSMDDISLLLYSHASEIRAVAKKYVYRMINNNGRGISISRKTIEMWYQRALDDIMYDIRTGKIDGNPYNMAWELVAKRYDLTYIVEER